jgi:hypothetical protein
MRLTLNFLMPGLVLVNKGSAAEAALPYPGTLVKTGKLSPAALALYAAASNSTTGAVYTGNSFFTQLPKRETVAIASINVVILFMFQSF